MITITVTNDRYGEDTIYAYIAEERRAAYQDASAIYGQWMEDDPVHKLQSLYGNNGYCGCEDTRFRILIVYIHYSNIRNSRRTETSTYLATILLCTPISKAPLRLDSRIAGGGGGAVGHYITLIGALIMKKSVAVCWN